MLPLHRFASFLQSVCLTKRFYARKTVASRDTNMKQVHKELLRYVSPYANIKIDSDIYIKVSSVNPHKYSNGNALIVELHGGPVKNCTASMEVKVSGDCDQNVEVVLKELKKPTDFHCELAVPIKAALNIKCRHSVTAHNIFGEELKVNAVKFIDTKNIKGENIELLCTDGDIKCQDILLGKETLVETKNKGNVIFDKLQGGSITCKTTQGNISTNCCYAEQSKFETNTGNLDLKNVHKKTSVFVHKKGDLKMIGVHGNLEAFINEGNINLQLSELKGYNTVQINKFSKSVINISDHIENNTVIEVALEDNGENCINLDETLKHLTPALNVSKQHLKWSLKKKTENKLTVSSKSSVTLGKSSWMDIMRMEMSAKQSAIE